jgi:hypothetical protein
MTTDRQFKANRENARKSTGPITTEGKARSSGNAVKHGLLAKTIITNANAFGWDEVELEEFVATLRDDIQPHGAIEEMYFAEMVTTSVRLLMVLKFEAKAARRQAANDLANAVGIDDLTVQSDFEFVSRIQNRDCRYFESLIERLGVLHKLNRCFEVEEELTSQLPGFILRSMLAPMPELNLKEFDLASQEARLDLSNILGLGYSTWKHAEMLNIQRSRLSKALHIVQNAKSFASQPQPFEPEGTVKAPRVDLLIRYERSLISIRREAIRFFEQRRAREDRWLKSEPSMPQAADRPNEANSEAKIK